MTTITWRTQLQIAISGSRSFLKLLHLSGSLLPGKGITGSQEREKASKKINQLFCRLSFPA